MSVVTFLKLLLSLASSVASYVHDKQLMEAGAAKSILEGIQNVQDRIAIAKSASDAANSVPITEDKNDRDYIDKNNSL